MRLRPEAALALLALVLVVATSLAYPIPKGSKVVELRAEDVMNRSHALYKGHEWWLVKYYKPECGASLRLAPEWENLADDQIDELEFVVARYNCEASPKAKQLCQNHNKLYFPDITLFRRGQFVGQLPFETDANVREILKWARPTKTKFAEDLKRIREEEGRSRRGL